MTGHDVSFWQAIYDLETRPGWDLGRPSPLLAEVLDLVGILKVDPGPAMAVPGCGYGHDVAELARRGYRATGFDFAPAALQGARERHGEGPAWRQEDWLVGAVPEFNGVFDYTCFVAMAPPQRAAFVAATADRLLPGGLWLAGCFHTVANPPGPPYAMAMDEVRALAEVRFEVLHLDHATRSHPRRAGREFLLVARKR